LCQANSRLNSARSGRAAKRLVPSAKPTRCALRRGGARVIGLGSRFRRFQGGAPRALSPCSFKTLIVEKSWLEALGPRPPPPGCSASNVARRTEPIEPKPGGVASVRRPFHGNRRDNRYPEWAVPLVPGAMRVMLLLFAGLAFFSPAFRRALPTRLFPLVRWRRVMGRKKRWAEMIPRNPGPRQMRGQSVSWEERGEGRTGRRIFAHDVGENDGWQVAGHLRAGRASQGAQQRACTSSRKVVWAASSTAGV